MSTITTDPNYVLRSSATNGQSMYEYFEKKMFRIIGNERQDFDHAILVKRVFIFLDEIKISSEAAERKFHIYREQSENALLSLIRKLIDQIYKVDTDLKAKSFARVTKLFFEKSEL